MEAKLSNVQLTQLEILKEFIRVCNDLHLQYFLVEGSMLGAVRHKGFIPWDDDIDVAIPREDYEIFLKEANSKLKSPYYLGTFNDDNFYLSLIHISEPTRH